MAKRIADKTGQTFGWLKVLERAPNNARNQTRWRCRCRCGREHVVDDYWLSIGRIVSCGCKRGTPGGKGHGQANKTSEYGAWVTMIARCENPNAERYPLYGGRGIKVCARWRKSFAAFFADMGTKPSPTHMLDRRNNDGDYKKSNCRWATNEEQAQNRSSSKLTARDVRAIRKARAGAEPPTQAALAEKYGVSLTMISHVVRGLTWKNVDGPRVARQSRGVH